MTPNIASVISSASNANGSASAFLFAAASEPEAAFSVPFPEAYARRTTTERQSQTIHIDPPPRALLSPPPTTRTNPPSRDARLVAFECASSRARARALASISHLCRLLPARGCAHTDATRSHPVSLRTHPSSPPPPPARVSHHPSPTTASSHRVRGRVPARIARHRPRASVPRPRGRAVTSRERSHAPSLELARGTDALRFVARVMIPRRVAPRRRRVRARRSPQPYGCRPNPSACVVYRVPMKEAVLS